LPQETGTTLAAELERVAAASGSPIRVQWATGVTVPLDLEPLTQSVLSEALRNVSKHAAATAIDVGVFRDEDTFKLEIRNDGVSHAARGPGIGLRLAAFEALQHGGMVEFGPTADAGWRVRLVVPLKRDEAREVR